MKQALGPDFNTHLWRYPGGHFSWKGLTGADTGLVRLGLDWIHWNAAVGDASGSGTSAENRGSYATVSLAVFDGLSRQPRTRCINA